METNWQKIKFLVAQADLSQKEINSLLLLFSTANDEDLKEVAELFSEDPRMVKKISDNYQAKRVAIQAGDPTRWSSIVQSELMGVE
jgi:hypothetical protein